MLTAGDLYLDLALVWDLQQIDLPDRDRGRVYRLGPVRPGQAGYGLDH
jgi:hypothetical protein